MGLGYTIRRRDVLLQRAQKAPGTRQTARGLSRYLLGLKPGSEPPETALAGRLRETLTPEKWKKQVLALKLHIRKAAAGPWVNGRFPRRKPWPALVKAGMATEAELLAWPPLREPNPNTPWPASWFVRNAQIYNLLRKYAQCAVVHVRVFSSSLGEAVPHCDCG